jgi:hypothetical protein
MSCYDKHNECFGYAVSVKNVETEEKHKRRADRRIDGNTTSSLEDRDHESIEHELRKQKKRRVSITTTLTRKDISIQ